MHPLVRNIAIVLTAGCMLASCTKQHNDPPLPDEPELITTVRVKAVDAMDPKDVRYFSYKVDNGFHGTGEATFHVDTIRLKAGTFYSIELSVLDETKSPVKDVTPEIIEEKNSHLFYYQSTPSLGAGSITVSGRDVDHNGQDFARTCKWETNAKGRGVMEIQLIHGPRDKEGADRNDIAGSTDAETIFPVELY